MIWKLLNEGVLCSCLEVQSGRVVDLLPNKYRHLGNKQTRRSFFFVHSHNVSFPFDSRNVLIYFGSILLSEKSREFSQRILLHRLLLCYLTFEGMLYIYIVFRCCHSWCVRPAVFSVDDFVPFRLLLEIVFWVFFNYINIEYDKIYFKLSL